MMTWEMFNMGRINEEDEIMDKVLDWIIETPFTFLLIFLGVLYLGHRISKALLYPIQALNGVLLFIKSLKQSGKGLNTWYVKRDIIKCYILTFFSFLV